MIRFSTGLRNALLGTDCFRTVMTLCFIDVFPGAQPSSANTAPGATALMTYSVNHDGVTGMTWAAPSAGTINKTASESVQAVGAVAGTAGWYRVRLAGDAGTTNTTDLRLDGSIANSGSDMDMTNLAITVGTTRSLDSFPIDLAENT